jgi:hypothetical protein
VHARRPASSAPAPGTCTGAGQSRPGGLAAAQDNFLTFRARCKDLLSDERFAEIDAVYRKAFDATRSWLADQDPRRRRRDMSADEVAQQLRILTDSSRSPEETTVRLRAFQAAGFGYGLLIQAVEVRTGRPADVPALAFNHHVSARVRRLGTPEVTCGWRSPAL